MSFSHLADPGAQRHLLISGRLRERRRSLGLTQKQVVSRLARLGVSSSNKALSSLEHGSGIDVSKLPELALALDCSVTWLLGLTDDPTAWEPDGLPPGHEPSGATRNPDRPREVSRPYILGPVPSATGR